MLSSILLILLAACQSKLIHIKSIVPNAGPLTGNTRVRVRGDNLQQKEEYPSPKCKFGMNSKVVDAFYVNCTPHPFRPGDLEPTTAEKTDHCLECLSPQSDRADMVPFTISLTGDFTDVQNALDFVYYQMPVVNKIIPPYGPKNGGTIVTVYGENFIDFDQFLRCSVGNTDVAAEFLSDTVLQCATPYSDTINVGMPFTVTMNDQQNTHQDIKYWYYSEPAITKLIPDRGPTSGGNIVEVYGEHLDPFNDMLDVVDNHADTYCRFGMDYMTLANVTGDDLVLCIAPPSPIIRTVYVDVTLNDADFKLNPDSWTDDHLPYTYYAPAYIYDVYPKISPTKTKTPVVISGSNFNDTQDITCKFGEFVVEGEFISVNQIHCTTPEFEKAGQIEISVSLEGDNYGDSLPFLVYEAPVITGLTPICGPVSGYTQVTVTGQNFIFTGKDLIFCIFDEIYTPATVMSSTQIKCDSPDITLNADMLDKMQAEIFVTLNGKDKSTSSEKLMFYYYEFHKLYSMVPSRGPITGETNVEIIGEKFNGGCNVTARFGTIEVLTISHNDTNLLADSPPVAVPGNAIIQVALNGQQYTEMKGKNNIGGSLGQNDGLDFDFYQVPYVTNFYPKQGPSSGNSTIFIYGTGFTSENNTEAYLRFNNSANSDYFGMANCYQIELNQLKCLTPAGQENQFATLEISSNGVDYVQIQNTGAEPSEDLYYFYSSPIVTGISPQYGPVKADQVSNITVIGTGFSQVNDDYSQTYCKFGTHPYPLYKKGYRLDETHIECELPRLSRPEVVTVQVSLNGYDYTVNQFNYTYYDAYVLDIQPKFGRIEGGTLIKVMGFGFANTGSDLVCKYGSDEKPLKCKGGDCITEAVYISDTEIECVTFDQKDVIYAQTGENIGSDPFEVEIAVRNREFTQSGVKFFYASEPDYLDLDPLFGSANGGDFLVIMTEFHWAVNGTEGYDVDYLIKNSDVRVKFVGEEETKIIEGNIITYPFSSNEKPNAIGVLSPSWEINELVQVYVTINGEDYRGDFYFNFKGKLDFTGMQPSCGPNEGETLVTIQGSGFTDDSNNLHLKWGTESRLVESDADDIIKGYSAPTSTNNTHGGFIYVEIGHNRELEDTQNTTYTFYGDYTHSNMLYFYYKRPVVQYIFPLGGSNSQSTEVTVAGAWFINYPNINCVPYCRFDQQVVPGEFISTVRIKCTAPPRPGFSGAVPVQISFNQEDWVGGKDMFVYYKTPVVTQVSPTLGPSTGGTAIAIHGSNFTGQVNPDDFLCRFRSLSVEMADKIVKGEYYNQTLIYCRSPGGWGIGTKASVDITFNGHDYTDSKSNFYFFQIDGARPMAGPTSGSDLGISVYGSGFQQNEKALCVLNNVEESPLKIEFNRIVCPMPPSDNGEGEVPFQVSANGVDFLKFEQGFMYYNQPELFDVEPSTGPVSGGSLLSVVGSGFRDTFQQANATCRIGKTASPAHIIDSQNLQCTTVSMPRPANSTALPIQISLNGQDYTSNSHYYEVYGMIDMAPKGGPIEGGTEVYIKGFGFKNQQPRCRFGIGTKNIMVPAQIIDDQRLICFSPSGFKVPDYAELPLDIPVQVAFSEQKYRPWTITDNKFRFYENPKISSLNPDNGWVDEQYSVEIVSDLKKHFFPAITGWKNSGQLDRLHAIVCRFGHFGTVPAQYFNETLIKCVTPDTKLQRKDVHSQTVKVEVALNGQDFFDAGNYTFKGNASSLWLVLMWLFMIILIVAIILLLGVCCYQVWYKRSLQPVPGAVGVRQIGDDRPHVFRDDDGVIRPSASPMRESELGSIRN